MIDRKQIEFKITQEKEFRKSLRKSLQEEIDKERFLFRKKRRLFMLAYRWMDNFSKKDEKVIIDEVGKIFLELIKK